MLSMMRPEGTHSCFAKLCFHARLSRKAASVGPAGAASAGGPPCPRCSSEFGEVSVELGEVVGGGDQAPLGACG
jgi:hypothetical protein